MAAQWDHTGREHNESVSSGAYMIAKRALDTHDPDERKLASPTEAASDAPTNKGQHRARTNYTYRGQGHRHWRHVGERIVPPASSAFPTVFIWASLL